MNDAKRNHPHDTVTARPTGMGNVAGIAFIPNNGITRLLVDGRRLRVLRAWYQEKPGGPQLSVTLIPRDKTTLESIERLTGGTTVRFHGRPRPWSNSGQTVMAVICDAITPIP